MFSLWSSCSVDELPRSNELIPTCPLSSGSISIKLLLERAGLPDVRFHDLRHSVATILFAAGVDLKVISELLGHSSIAVTSDVYAHLLPDMQRTVVNKMDDPFGSL